MKYVDIFSDAISYFTNIPPDFVRGYIEKCQICGMEKNRELLDYIMDIEFPEMEGEILLSDLKSGDLKSTIMFFNNSLSIIRQEEQRQALVN